MQGKWDKDYVKAYLQMTTRYAIWAPRVSRASKGYVLSSRDCVAASSPDAALLKELTMLENPDDFPLP
jgi:hypothetical protein